MNNWFLLLPAWYLSWVFVMLLYDAWKKRPWKRKLRSYARQLGWSILLLTALVLALTVLRMWIKGRLFSPEKWKSALDDMLPLLIVMLFYCALFLIILLVLTCTGLRQDGIEVKMVFRIFLRKLFQAAGVLALGFLLVIVLGAIIGKGSIFDKEGRGLLANSWAVAVFVFMPTIVALWHSVVKEARKKQEEGKEQKAKHLIKLKS